MKRRIIVLVIIGVILAVIGGSIIVLPNLKKQPYVDEFNLAKYQWEIENFPSNKNVGIVNNPNTAIEKAKELWIESFSSKSYNPINGRKILVFYDSSNECWHIKGTLPSNEDGAVPNVLIQNDGKVLAVWMG